MSKEQSEEKGKFYNKIWFWLLIIVLIFILIFLPYFGKLYNVFVLESKVDKNIINLSRSDLLRIYISLVGPCLTFIVFKNTLDIQKENREKYEQDKLADIKRKNIDDTNREFYNLLQLFNKRQLAAEKVIEKLYSNAIYSDKGYDFINDYNSIEVSVPSNIGNVSVIRTMRSEGPDFKEPEAYEPVINAKNGDISLIIINEQYDSVYDVLGPYFKVLHRIVKSLNKRLENKSLEIDDYKNYIGILRSQISSAEFIVILVNSLFVKRGLGLGVELVGANFFGNKKDFSLNQHFDIPPIKISLKDILIFEYNKVNVNERIKLREQLEITHVANFKSLLNQIK